MAQPYGECGMSLRTLAFRAKSKIKQGLGISQPSSITQFQGDPSLQNSERTDLHKMFYEHSGPLIHKWVHYLDDYDRFLGKYRGTALRVLEIGVSQGGSLSLWRKYLGRNARIFGIDIDNRCAQFDGRDGCVRIGSQADSAFLRSVFR
jgi:hypothetical protein